MAKGFSFILAAVVMVMMLVFGMLSLSSAAAGLRQARKAADEQSAYYELDTRGERLRALCDSAAAGAWSDAGDFTAHRASGSALPADLDAALRQEVLSARDTAALRRGMFLYYFVRRLRAEHFDTAYTCAVDAAQLGRLAAGQAGLSPVTVDAALTGTLNPHDTLHVTLVCRFGSDGVPSVAANRWQAAVSGLEITSSRTVRLWNGT